jgi:mono/diheme cytochrome c family protein
MSMKRCFELSLFPPVSLIGRVVLVGSVLCFAAACGRRDAAKADSSTADSATSSTTAAATNSSSPVESISTGETTVSTESKTSPAVAASNVTTTPATPAHRTVHHTDSAKATSPAAATVRTVSDTGEKTPADTSKKAAGAADGVDHLLVSPQEYEGWKMFSVYCYRCHGVDAMGGGIAPNLRHSVSSEGSVTHEVFITTVTNGRLDKGMPTWKALLSPEQMEDLWLYVNARSSNRLYPGRPHMAKGANP